MADLSNTVVCLSREPLGLKVRFRLLSRQGVQRNAQAETPKQNRLSRTTEDLCTLCLLNRQGLNVKLNAGQSETTQLTGSLCKGTNSIGLYRLPVQRQEVN